MEPYEIKTVRIELPYIKLTGTQFFTMPEVYKEPGLYFVESPQEEIALVFFPRPDLQPEIWGLPNALTNRISKLMAEAEVWKPTMDSMKDDFQKVHEFISSIKDVFLENSREVCAAFSETSAHVCANRKAVEQLKSAVETFGQSKKESSVPEGGYITESTLVEIIDKVRK